MRSKSLDQFLAETTKSAGARWVHNHQPGGERHALAKLRQVDVERIKEARKFGATIKDLAAVWPVSETQIHRICKGSRWR